MSDGREAEETKDWDRFWGSGRVEDYLRYRNCHAGKLQGAQEERKTDWKYVDGRDRFG